MSAENRSLLLLTAFARALSHNIRTPLAVISNELSILASNDPDGVKVASDRLREIVSLLKGCIPINPATLVIESVELGPALAPFGSAPGSKGVLVRADRAALDAAFLLLLRMLQLHAAPGFRAEVGSTREDVAVVLLTGSWNAAESSAEIESDSITEFLSVRLGLDSIEAPLIDGMLEALGIPIHIALGIPPSRADDFIMRLEISRAKEP